jgi:alpha-tubulin suppressor-like RCC1 family protein
MPESASSHERNSVDVAPRRVPASLLFASGLCVVAIACSDVVRPALPSGARIDLVSGASQLAFSGDSLPQPVVLRLRDSLGSPLHVGTVTIRLDSGGGTSSSVVAAAQPDMNGFASFRLALPPTPATYHYSAVADESPLVKVDFIETAVFPPTSDSGVLISASLDGYSYLGGYTGEVVSPRIFVTDRLYHPLSGMTLRLSVSPGGFISDTVVTTNSSGQAAAKQWTLGPIVGADTLTVRLRSLSTVVVAAATSGPPATIIPDSEILQAAPDSLLSNPIRLTVRDAQGRGVVGAPVTWLDDYSSDSCTTTTGRNGVTWSIPPLATTNGCRWQADSRLGTHTLRVTSGIAAAQITVAVVAKPVGINAVSKSATGYFAPGTVLPDSVVFQLQPPPGGSVAGYLVRFISGNQFSSNFADSALTDITGTARVRWKLGPALGAQVLSASVVAYPAVTASFTVLSAGQPQYGAVAAGAAHTCALTDVALAASSYAHYAPPVVCWGRNSEGEIGDGSTIMRPSPTALRNATSSPYNFSIAAGVTSSCTEYDDDQGVEISPRSFTTILAPRALVCWGGNTTGQAGAAPSLSVAATPVGEMLSKPGVGTAHACAIRIRIQGSSAAPDSILCWGDNQYGELGDGTRTSRSTPASIQGVVGTPAILGAGDGFTCAVNTSGQAFCWGRNSEGQLGDQTSADRSSAAPVAINTRFAAMSAGLVPTGIQPEFSVGKAHACGIGVDARAYCWGRNAFGQLGDGSQASRPVPVVVASPVSFAAIAAGGEHSCAIASDGAAYCWGNNDHGQLGTGAAGGVVTSPAAVVGGLRFQTISAGGAHTCGLTTDSRVFCWGSNSDGQLGDGTTTDRAAPVQVSDYRPDASATASMARGRKR